MSDSASLSGSASSGASTMLTMSTVSETSSDRDDCASVASAGSSGSQKRPRRGEGHFLNQLTLTFEDVHSNKSIKIFRNRTMHITGCKSPSEARVVATFVWDLLCQVYPDTHALLYKQRIAMVNATCELNYSFNPTTNQRIMSERYKNNIIYVVTGKDRKYPGTILKIAGHSGADVTVMMFASGNLTLSCGSLRDMVDAYKFIGTYYHTEKPVIMSREPILSKRKIDSAKNKRKYELKKPRKNAKPVDYFLV